MAEAPQGYRYLYRRHATTLQKEQRDYREEHTYLEGHAETDVNPQSGVPINLGVIAFPQTQTQIVKDYLFCPLQCPVGNIQLVLFGRHIH